ncbi:MAG: hypothetical protein GON13_03660 [Nanoarchaeota archaeon]|nr:hypothetical protein [Nanoarchaeota archaeon]
MGRRAILTTLVILALLPVVINEVKAETCTTDSDCSNYTYCDADACNGRITGICDTSISECACCITDGDCSSGYTCSTEGYCYDNSNYCGDGTCQDEEDCEQCPSDCGTCSVASVCGDGVCDADEDATNNFCEADCTYTTIGTDVCGNEICEGSENCDNCYVDCCEDNTITVECGNGICEDGEDCGSCSTDCWCDWEQEQQQKIDAYKATLILTSEEQTLASTIINSLKAVHTAATAYISSPSGTTAYNLAYQQRLKEQSFWDLEKNYAGTTLKKSGEYAILNYGSGRVNAWEDEFGNFQINGLDIIEGSGIRFGAHIWYNDWENKYGIGMWVDWDDNARNYEENIKNGWMDGEDVARQAQAAEDVKEIIATFTITDDNKEIANELINYMDTVYDLANEFTLNSDKIYKLQYEAELLNARMNGVAEGLSCNDVNEVSTYILVYSKGSVEVWDDEFGGKTLAQHKRLLDTDYVKLEINAGGCDDWSERGWMGTNLQWSRTVTENENYRTAITNARKSAWREAEALRQRYMVLEAKKLYTFTVEEENIAKEIIEKLNKFKEEIKEFEAGKVTAYKLHYDSILLTSELEGYSWAYPEIAKGIGEYVLLNGPGIPDVWKDEFGDIELGHNLRVHFGENIEFNLNRWCDEWRDFCGFNSWMQWGQLREDYRDDIKKAERDGWREAERKKRKTLADKFRKELQGEIEDVYSSAIKSFVSKAKNFMEGGATAYDVEMTRLEASYLLQKNIDEQKRDFIMVLDLGEDVPPPEAWLDWETGEIHIGGWRELVLTSKDGKEDVIAGMDTWCDDWDGFCGGNIWMNWPEWDRIKTDIHRANNDFWRQKREEEIKPMLSEIISKKTTYSSKDQTLINELSDLIETVEELGENYDTLGVENFQYSILVKRDVINDKLITAQDGSLIEIAVAEAEGYHDYDDWMQRLYGVAVYTGEKIDLVIRFYEKFTPFFLEAIEKTQGSEFAIEIEIVWKEWQEGMEKSIENAYEKYEKEQSGVRLTKLVEQREKIISEVDNIETKVNSYENNEISLSQLRKYVNSIYYKIQAYDQEVAYYAAMSGQEFPTFEFVNVKINTEHVKMELYEKDFEYRFGGGIGVFQAKTYNNDQEREYELEFAPTNVETTKVVKQTSSDSFIQEEYNEQGFEEFTGNFIAVTGRPIQPITTDVKAISSTAVSTTLAKGDVQDTEIEIFDEDVAREIEFEKQKIVEERYEDISMFREQEMETKSINKIINKKKGYSGERIIIKGIKPRLKLSTQMTDTEIMRLAEELKTKWSEAAELGYIDDAVYNMNMHIDNFPALQEAITSWGDTALSLKLNYKENSVFEFSFKTEDGYIGWVKYGIAENAGSGSDNIYIELDFESLLRLRNWWEDKLKNAEGIMDVIGAVPGFLGNMIGMLMNGEIVIQPFGSISKIPQFLSVFFEGIVHTTGVEI